MYLIFSLLPGGAVSVTIPALRVKGQAQRVKEFAGTQGPVRDRPRSQHPILGLEAFQRVPRSYYWD